MLPLARAELQADGTARSQKAVRDFVLSAQISVPLAEKGYEVEVSCDDGEVTLSINKYVMRRSHLEKELTKIVSSLPGVRGVRIELGPHYQLPSIYRDFDFPRPPKVLLVDDEREFVETLSERLQARELESAVAYSDALE